jgi:hypothetical protein
MRPSSRSRRAWPRGNGYTAEQSSDLYITDGDQIDWMYGRYRIFSYTWELYPTETPTVWGDHYPDDSKIAAAVSHNRSAPDLLPAPGLVPVPAGQRDHGKLRAALRRRRGQPRLGGQPGRDRHGARERPVQPGGAAADVGLRRADPAGERDLRPVRVRDRCGRGNDRDRNDLDGTSTLRSAPIALADPSGVLSFRYTFGHGPSSSADFLAAYVEDAAGHRTLVWKKAGTSGTVAAAWTRAAVSLDSWAGTTIRIVFRATDAAPDSLVEAALDDIRVERRVTT